MHLTHLSLTNFRNFARLDVDIPQGAVLLVGANAQGKTSLLEAIYYLATFSSFHAGNDRQLINFLAGRDVLSVARIVADLRREEATARTHRIEVRIIQEANGLSGETRLRKEVLLDGAKSKVADLMGYFNAVLFLPQSLRVIEGAPEERRRYLNMTLSQVIPRYAEQLSEYNHALSQRNALLKQLGEYGGDAEQLVYWDEQLTAVGAFLIHARIQAIQELERLAIPIHSEITRDVEILRLAYEPAYDPLPQPSKQYRLPLDSAFDRSCIAVDKIMQGFQERLLLLRSEEIARGLTTIGPHRDDLRFLSNSIDLGVYGSRGQTRTAMLALKLAEVAWMKARSGQWPVLLLDEVLAELDQDRRADLIERLAQGEQIMMTTTDLDLFPSNLVHTATLWQVQAGRLHAVRSGA
jgi:DNA replication and repair protein RecF